MTTQVIHPAGVLDWQFGTGAAVGGANSTDATVLASDDGDTSYFSWNAVDNLNINYEPFALPVNATITGLTLHLVARSVDGAADSLDAGIYVNVDAVGPHGYLGFVTLNLPGDGAWYPLDVIYDQSEILIGLAGLSTPATMDDLAASIREGSLSASVTEHASSSVLHLTYAPILLDYTTVPGQVRQRQIPGEVRQRQVPGLVRQREMPR